ncbi:hypothetical protein N1614_09810 [Adlercreutzia muris]|uniref:hypothetical protein n=1 Tax=Adlercreutzia muris TaxID=1796610 RepID=UPI002171D8D9|nr:hypothetical protein [Adlercreutzia muris]MCI8306155.1 hypothetical protein [Enterorhabdus sp.]MCU7585642.1 hypothetical protein [Adlercreutzia muris]
MAATYEKRGGANVIADYEKTLSAVRKDEGLTKLWARYLETHSYAASIEFPETCDSVTKAMGVIKAYLR